MLRSRFSLSTTGTFLTIVVVAFALTARSAAASTWACNAADLYSKITGCTSGGSTCTIAEDVVCDTANCGGNCTYDLGTSKTLTVSGATGKLSGINGRAITARAKNITTDGTTNKVRFTGSAVTLTTADASHASGDGLDIDISGEITGGTITVAGGKVKVRDITAPGFSVLVSGSATESNNGTLEASGTIDVSVNTTVNGGFIWLNAGKTVLVSNTATKSILARTNGGNGSFAPGVSSSPQVERKPAEIDPPSRSTAHSRRTRPAAVRLVGQS